MRFSNTLVECALGASALLGLLLLSIYVRFVYLYNSQILPEMYFWVFAVMFAGSLMLLWSVNPDGRTPLLLTLVASVVLGALLFLRFYFYGQDLVGELFVAQATLDAGRWPVQQTGSSYPWLQIEDLAHTIPRSAGLTNDYFSATSVTILPSVVSQVMGASVLVVFRILIVTVNLSLAILVFLVVRFCIGRRTGILASLIFVFDYAPSMLRQDIALLFLLMAILYILKGRGRGDGFVAVISLCSIPMAHYGTTYFALFGLSTLLIAKRLWNTGSFRRFRENRKEAESPGISISLFLYAVVAGIAWLFLVATSIILRNVGSAIRAVEAMIGLAPAQYSRFQQSVIFSTLGPFNAVVQWLERILSVAGLVLTLRMVRSLRRLSFVFYCGGLLGLLLAFAFVPRITLVFDLNRLRDIALLGSSAFTAVSLVWIKNKARSWGAFVSVLIVVLIFLGSIHIPILYTPPSSLTRDEYIFSFSSLLAFYEPSDFDFAKWVRMNTSPCALFASDVRAANVLQIADRNALLPRVRDASEAVTLIEGGATDYFAVLSYVPDYLAYDKTNGGRGVLSPEDTQSLLTSNDLNRVYGNGRAILFGYKLVYCQCWVSVGFR